MKIKRHRTTCHRGPRNGHRRPYITNDTSDISNATIDTTKMGRRERRHMRKANRQCRNARRSPKKQQQQQQQHKKNKTKGAVSKDAHKRRCSARPRKGRKKPARKSFRPHGCQYDAFVCAVPVTVT